MPLSEAKQKITKFSPQFNLKSLRLLGRGTESAAYLVNEEWVFRFPDQSVITQKTIETEIEIALLPKLYNSLPVKIPDFKYVARDNDKLIYVGYQLLLGVPLDKNVFEAMDADQQEKILKGFASFLKSLHRFPVDVARSCGVKEELYKGAYNPEQKYLYESFRHLLSQDELEKIKAIFIKYENNKKNIFVPSLLHADLKPEHILYNPENGHITGIIDWGDVCIGDPDFDFTCPYLFYGHEFVVKLLKYFPDFDCGHIISKIQFFVMVRWLQDIALFFKSGDEKFVGFCLKNLKSHLKKCQAI